MHRLNEGLRDYELMVNGFLALGIFCLHHPYMIHQYVCYVCPLLSANFFCMLMEQPYIQRIIRAALFAAASLTPFLPRAEGGGDALHGDSAVVLSEVVVKGAPRSATPSQIIGREIISAMPSSSVADALKYMAGVQIKDYGGLGGQKTVNVRSLGSQHVGVYIDGVRVTNVQNGTVDLGKYSLSTLESVSLFNANKSEALMMASEYASASTVYLQTHKPRNSSLQASATLGSFGTSKAAATWNFVADGASPDAIAGFIDAAYTYSKGNYPFRYHTEYEDTTGRRRNSDIRMVRAESCLFWKGLQWHTYYFDSERGLPGGIVRRLSDAYTDVGREWDRNFFTQLAYRKTFSLPGSHGLVGVRGILKYTNDRLHYRSDYPENISVHANNRYRQQDLYGAFASSWEKECASDLSFKVSLSSDLRWSDLTTDVKNFSYVYRLDSKTSLAAFIDYRHLHVNLSGLYTDVTDRTRGNAKPLRRLTYNVLASYAIKDFTLRAFYKSVFRAPTLNDLYYTLVGNRNLRPEYTRQLDAGLTYTLSSSPYGLAMDIQLDGYYNHVEDRIVCLPLKGSYQWTMLNYGYTRSLGADLTANISYRTNSLLLSATFQDDRNLTDPDDDSYNDFSAYSPRWSLTAVYAFHCKGWSASVSHMFVDKRYWTAENAIEPPLEAYNCTDAKVGYKLGLRRTASLTFEVECQNIFDDRYEIIQRWPMPGRRFAATIKFQI